MRQDGTQRIRPRAFHQQRQGWRDHGAQRRAQASQKIDLLRLHMPRGARALNRHDADQSVPSLASYPMPSTEGWDSTLGLGERC